MMDTNSSWWKLQCGYRSLDGWEICSGWGSWKVERAEPKEIEFIRNIYHCDTCILCLWGGWEHVIIKSATFMNLANDYRTLDPEELAFASLSTPIVGRLQQLFASA